MKPVPKVAAQSIAGLVTALIVAILVGYGWEGEQATQIGGLVATLVIALAPVAVGFISGWLKTDTERADFIRIIMELRQQIADYDTGEAE